MYAFLTISISYHKWERLSFDTPSHVEPALSVFLAELPSSCHYIIYCDVPGSPLVNCPISVGPIFLKLTYLPLEVNAYVVMHFSIEYCNMAYKRPQINALSQKKLLPRGGKWKCQNPASYNRLPPRSVGTWSTLHLASNKIFPLAACLVAARAVRWRPRLAGTWQYLQMVQLWECWLRDWEMDAHTQMGPVLYLRPLTQEGIISPPPPISVYRNRNPIWWVYKAMKIPLQTPLTNTPCSLM